MRLAVIKTGGKQYLVKSGDELYVDRLPIDAKKKVGLETLAFFDTDTDNIELGKPLLDKKVNAEVLEHLKADKIRVARFKAKVRYRKVKGYRHLVSKVKILKI